MAGWRLSCWLELLLVHSGLSPWAASLLVRSCLALHWPFTGSRGFEARHLVLARGLRSREDSGIRSREVRNSFFGPLLELRPADRLAFGTSCTRCTPAARVCSANASSCSLARGTVQLHRGAQSAAPSQTYLATSSSGPFGFAEARSSRFRRSRGALNGPLPSRSWSYPSASRAATGPSGCVPLRERVGRVHREFVRVAKRKKN